MHFLESAPRIFTFISFSQWGQKWWHISLVCIYKYIVTGHAIFMQNIKWLLPPHYFWAQGAFLFACINIYAIFHAAAAGELRMEEISFEIANTFLSLLLIPDF